MSTSLPILNNDNFVTSFNGFDIFKVSDNQFIGVKRTTNISRKVTDSFTTTTLLEAVSKAMNGQRLSANQLARVRTAVTDFSSGELAKYFVLACVR